MINQLKKPIVIVSVTTLVPLLNVGGWSTSTQKRIFVLIPPAPPPREEEDDSYK